MDQITIKVTSDLIKNPAITDENQKASEMLQTKVLIEQNDQIIHESTVIHNDEIYRDRDKLISQFFEIANKLHLMVYPGYCILSCQKGLKLGSDK